MLKKTISFTDFDGNQRTEDFYFNLTKAEVTEMEMTVEGGLGKKLERIIQEQDMEKIIKEFKEIIRKAYGVKSPDGRRFIKNQEVFEAFEQTEAYSELFMELATNAEAAAEFVNGIIPQITEAPKTPH